MASTALILLVISQLSSLHVNGDSYFLAGGGTGDAVKKIGTRNAHVQQSEVAIMFTAVLNKLTALDQRITSLDQRFTSLDQRLTSLDQRFTFLERRPSDCTTERTKEKEEGLEVEEEKPEEGAFRFKRVSRKETENGYKVTITFEGEIELPVYIRFDWARNEPADRYGTVDLERGQVEVFLTEPVPERPSFVFKSGDSSYVLGLHINDTYRSGARDWLDEQDVPNVRAITAPANDVIYSSGSDAELDVKFTLEDGKGGSSSREEHFFWSAVVMAAGSENLAYVYHQYSTDIPPSFPTFGEPTWHEERKTADGKTLAARFIINATEQDTDALFELTCSFEFNCSEEQACLLRDLSVSREVHYYRNDRTGPLPPHLLAFLRDWDSIIGQNSQVWFNDSDEWDTVQEEQKNVIWCDIDGQEPCQARINVISEEKLVNLEIRSVKSDEVVTNIKKYVTNTALGYWQESVATFENPTFGDSGEYVCTAETSARAIRQIFILQVVDFAKIDSEQSRITVHQNGSLEAVCKAHGVPAPNVWFDNSTYSNLAELPADEYHVTYSTEGNLTVATLTISDPDWASRVYGLDCKAANTGRGHGQYDWYYLSRYEEDWYGRK